MLELGEAREKAREALREISQGGDPAGDKRRRQPTSDAPSKDLVSDVVAKFLQRHVRRNGLRSAAEIEGSSPMTSCRSGANGPLRRSPAATFGPLNGLKDRGIGPMTNRVLAVVRKLFNWAVEEDILEASPCRG